MDKSTYEKQLSGRNSYWLRYGYKSRKAIAGATANWGTEDNAHPFFFNYIDNVRMDTVEKGDLSNDFIKSENNPAPNKLIPLIYCHGLTCTRTS